MNENRNIEANLGEDNFEERIVVEQLREDNPSITLVNGEKVGKIKSYRFNIKVRDREDLTGEITREEMDLVHRLYSSEGSNLTQRSVSTYFPNYTFQEFKKILRAFGIVKSSSPIAPHIIEEKSREDLIQLTYQNKEKDYLRKLEQDRAKETEVKLKEMTKKYFDLRNKYENISEVILNTNSVTPYKKSSDNIIKNSKYLILHISDIHFGAKVSNDSLYKNSYNRDVVKSRLENCLKKLENKQFEEVVINFLGDMLDGIDGYTCSHTHQLPQNMDNYEQVKAYIEVMEWFVVSLHKLNISNNISLYSVKSGNHDGVAAYVATSALFTKLKLILPEYNYTIFDTFFGYYEFAGHKWVITHGKDDKFMKKGMSLNITPQEKTMIINWLDDNGITGSNIHIIKGDLHSDNLNSCKKLDYRNVLSLFGASDYSNFNFDRNDYGISYEVIDNGELMRGSFINL